MSLDLFEFELTPRVGAETRVDSRARGDVDVARRLNLHSWDFPDSKSARGNLHAIHPYPAKFIPEIPRALISEFPPKPGTCVLDPFCGSGTTLVEARKLGHEAIGIDLNPIACLISRVKTGRPPERLAQWAGRCLATAESAARKIPDDIPNLGHWFKPHVSEAIAALIKSIETVAPLGCRDALNLALSSIIVRVSNQDSDTRYAAVEKPVTRKNVFERFVEAAGRIETALLDSPDTPASARVIEADILSVKPETIGSRVGLVVTSPPYPNAYEYWLYHKYRMWWLGFDALRVKEREIGARAHFFGGRATAGDFLVQMSGLFALLGRVCTDDAVACFVIGDSKIHGAIIDNAAVLDKAASSAGFVVAGRITRQMRSSRKSFNLSHARIRQEHILVFKRSGGAA